MEKKMTTPNLANAPKPIKQSETPAKIESKLPTLKELFDGNIMEVGKLEGLNAILNAAPPVAWVKERPYIKGHQYLPIDKVEYLLRKIFKAYRIEILREGHSFNGVYVVVRVHYRDPICGEMISHDGIGAIQLQTAKGTSPADLGNINNGALSMAYPLAKTLAIKDACDLIGNIFGANLNRRDAIAFQPDMELIDKYKNALAND